MVSVLVFKAGEQTYHRGVNRASGSTRDLLSGARLTLSSVNYGVTL